MKVLLTSILLFVSLWATTQPRVGGAPEGCSDAEAMGLRGSVSGIVERVYEVDFSRRVIEEAALRNVTKISFAYNGCCLSVSEEAPDGTVIGKTNFEYDTLGRLSHSEAFDANGRQKLQTFFLMTAEVAQTAAEDTLGGVFPLDSMNLTDDLGVAICRMKVTRGPGWAQIDEVYADAERKSTLYKYNSKNCLVGVSATGGDGQTTTAFKLNRQGYPEREETHRRTPGVKKTAQQVDTYARKYDYKYDAAGNWIERVKYEGGIPTELNRRTIEYYEH